MSHKIAGMSLRMDQQQIVQELVDRAQADNLELVGMDALLADLTETDHMVAGHGRNTYWSPFCIPPGSPKE